MSAPGGGGAYSFSLTTFSPSGKLVQIEHALAAVAGGTTSLGIKGGSLERSGTFVWRIYRYPTFLIIHSITDSSDERRRARDREEGHVGAD